jgi:hypothetical protein
VTVIRKQDHRHCVLGQPVADYFVAEIPFTGKNEPQVNIVFCNVSVRFCDKIVDMIVLETASVRYVPMTVFTINWQLRMHLRRMVKAK